MTTPKRNEAVAPCAWIVSNGSQCCEPWVVFEKSEVDAMPSACIAGAVYSQQTIDALQGEVSRLRGLLSDTAGNLRRMANDEFADCEQVRLEHVVNRIEDNLEPPTDGR